MNYLQLINQFWQIRRSKIITSTQADVYKYIIHESNMRNWENPLSITNGIICANIGITEKTLIDARNRLQQIGLIKFANGVTKKKAPLYTIVVDYCKNYSIGVSIGVSNEGGNEGGNGVSIEANINNKHKRKPKQNKIIIAPTLQEVKNFFSEKGYLPEIAEKAFNHYDLAGWKDTTGKEVKNWKQKMNTVWFKPEYKATASNARPPQKDYSDQKYQD